MAIRIGINGFGRIGRCVTRALLTSRGDADIELVAINDLTTVETLAHLLQFDSVHGRLPEDVSIEEGHFRYGKQRFATFAERDPAKIPWGKLGVDIVLECTGHFSDKAKSSAHLSAGAKRVIISAPGGSDIDGTFCVGINTDQYDPSKHTVISNASCTTNCLAPIAKVLHERFGIEKGHMVTVHSYTNDQRLLDLPHDNLRRARAAAVSMIPTSTGAAKAIGLVLPALKGKLDGTSIRVPTTDVSLTCLTAVVQKATTRDEINKAFEEAAKGELKGILGVEHRPLVSVDFVGDARSSIVDAAQTQVIEGNLVEVQSWYDNEWGFSNRMIDLAALIAKRSR